MCFTGSCDTHLFVFWIKEFLQKELKPGQTVVMDNASFHKSKEIEKIIESSGCKLVYLPAYSPDLNPIEKFWSCLTNKIRETAQLFDSLKKAIDHAFNSSHSYIIRL